jgi:SET domain-containing protein
MSTLKRGKNAATRGPRSPRGPCVCSSVATAKPAPPYVVRPSPTHGRGVFATRTIRRGVRIIEYCGVRLPRSVADERPATDPADTYHTLLFELSDGTVIDASLRGNAARWINHGCAPNCVAVEYDDGRVFIFAKRTIRAGEELRYDYHLDYEGRMSRRAQRAFACRCGAARCRGTMLSQHRSSNG